MLRKRQTADYKKTFANHISHKDSIYKNYRSLIKKQTIKNGQRFEQTFQLRIYADGK